jgi:hypothetical protein
MHLLQEALDFAALYDLLGSIRSWIQKPASSFGSVGRIYGTVWGSFAEVSEKRCAPGKGWNLKIGQRRQGRPGEKPKASHRDWVVGSAEKRGESSAEIVFQQIGWSSV